MEYWDLYDSERKPLGRTHLRGDKFEDGEYYVCCEIWVVNSEGKFLTTKRHPDKKAGNQWEFTGGGTLAGETTAKSAVPRKFPCGKLQCRRRVNEGGGRIEEKTFVALFQDYQKHH